MKGIRGRREAKSSKKYDYGRKQNHSCCCQQHIACLSGILYPSARQTHHQSNKKTILRRLRPLCHRLNGWHVLFFILSKDVHIGFIITPPPRLRKQSYAQAVDAGGQPAYTYLKSKFCRYSELCLTNRLKRYPASLLILDKLRQDLWLYLFFFQHLRKMRCLQSYQVPFLLSSSGL